MANPIQIWQFNDAPAPYQRLLEDGSPNQAGWLMLVPNIYAPEPLADNIAEQELLGSSSYETHEVDEGTVYIGLNFS